MVTVTSLWSQGASVLARRLRFRTISKSQPPSMHVNPYVPQCTIQMNDNATYRSDGVPLVNLYKSAVENRWKCPFIMQVTVCPMCVYLIRNKANCVLDHGHTITVDLLLLPPMGTRLQNQDRSSRGPRVHEHVKSIELLVPLVLIIKACTQGHSIRFNSFVAFSSLGFLVTLLSNLTTWLHSHIHTHTHTCSLAFCHEAASRCRRHAASRGDPPVSCLVTLVRHWPWCTLSEGPRLRKINPPRIERIERIAYIQHTHILTHTHTHTHTHTAYSYTE